MKGSKGEDSGADVPSTEKFRNREQIHARTAQGDYYFKERLTKKIQNVKSYFFEPLFYDRHETDS